MLSPTWSAVSRRLRRRGRRRVARVARASARGVRSRRHWLTPCGNIWTDRALRASLEQPIKRTSSVRARERKRVRGASKIQSPRQVVSSCCLGGQRGKNDWPGEKFQHKEHFLCNGGNRRAYLVGRFALRNRNTRQFYDFREPGSGCVGILLGLAGCSKRRTSREATALFQGISH